jgi:hypothetical protein
MVEGEQRGTVWPEDVPEDVLTGSGDQPAATTIPTATATTMDIEPAKRVNHLKLVE